MISSVFQHQWIEFHFFLYLTVFDNDLFPKRSIDIWGKWYGIGSGTFNRWHRTIIFYHSGRFDLPGSMSNKRGQIPQPQYWPTAQHWEVIIFVIKILLIANCEVFAPIISSLRHFALTYFLYVLRSWNEMERERSQHIVIYHAQNFGETHNKAEETIENSGAVSVGCKYLSLNT